jgi:hypothetical protein
MNKNKMNKSPFGHMLCLRSDDHFYKLVFIYTEELPKKTEELLIGEFASNIRKSIGYTMGYIAKSWEEKGMVIKHVDILLPPGGEYLMLQQRLHDSFMQRGQTLKVGIGVYIPIPGGNMRDNIGIINEKFREIAEKDFGNN